jgi:hypothetical protein
MPLQHDLPTIREAVANGRILWKKHALERTLERGMSRLSVKQAIQLGEIIEQYPDDYPVPSLLIAECGVEPLHVVLSWDAKSAQCHIMTAYRPDLAHFEADMKTRRTS